MIFGFAVGSAPPYQAGGRVEIRLEWGRIVETPATTDEKFDTEADAAEAGLELARAWIEHRAIKD